MRQRLGIARAKFARWTTAYGAVPTPRGRVPRDHWRTQAERDGIVQFHARYPLEGDRRLTYMLLDAGDVAVSPSSVYRVLQGAGRLDRWTRTPSKKGTGFDQPTHAHAHGHLDFTYVNIAGTFYYLCAIRDGWSRDLVHWELRESMTTRDVTTIVQRAHERFPDARPRIISDNGPQCIARDCREFIRLAGMTHVRTAPYSAVLSAVEPQVGTLESDAQGHPDSPGGPDVDHGSASPRHRLRHPRQRAAAAPRHRVHHAGRSLGRSVDADLGCAGRPP